MNNARTLPVYRRLFDGISRKHAIYRGLEEETDSSQALHDDLVACYDGTTMPRHAAWFTVQQYLYTIAVHQRRGLRQLDPTNRLYCLPDAFTQDELIVLGELAVHYWAACPTWQVCWPTLELVSAAQIDESVHGDHLLASALPPTIWIEWPATATATQYPPWIAGTRGVLISRLAAFDAPLADRETFAAQADTNRQADKADFMRLVATLARLDSPTGYFIIAVRERQDSLEYVPFLIGHESTASVRDMLVLFRQSSIVDRRKKKEVEQTWANVGMRLLLYAASSHLFAKTSRAELTAVPPSRLGPAIQFAAERGAIVMRKLAQRSWPPFRIES